VTGGTGPLALLWSNGSTDSHLSALCAGFYACTVSDTFCNSVFEYEIEDIHFTPWNYQVTGDNHTIILVDTMYSLIAGQPLQPGDFIGVFYDQSGVPECGGYVQWTGSTNALSAWGDDPLTPDKDGFYSGEIIQVQVWKMMSMTEHNVNTRFSPALPDQGVYVSSGLSGIDSLYTLSLSGMLSMTSKSFIQEAVVLLFDEEYRCIDLCRAEEGYYLFDELTPGGYFVYAVPAPYLGAGVAGYIGNDELWEQALPVQVITPVQNGDIQLPVMVPINLGNGSIHGKVLLGSGSHFETEFYGQDWFGTPTGSGSGFAKNVTVLLYNTSGQINAWTLTDEEGAFGFVGLPFGSYLLRAEKAGLSCIKYPVEISPTAPGLSDLVFMMGEDEIILRSVWPVSEEYIFAGPNPFREEIIIQTTGAHYGERVISVYTVTGQRIFHQTINLVSEGTSIPTEGWPAGIYLLEITDMQTRVSGKLIRF
jgi:hypothetical protein